jgi:hypothetical protein
VIRNEVRVVSRDALLVGLLLLGVCSSFRDDIAQAWSARRHELVSSVAAIDTRHCSLCSLSWRPALTALHPVKPKVFWKILRNSVRTAKKTQHVAVAKIDRLTAAYSENRAELRGQNAKLSIVNSCGICSCHWASKDSESNRNKNAELLILTLNEV